MQYFVLADVHGCLHTLRELLADWRPAEEVLVQLGDLVDRGNYSPETVELCCQLSRDFPDRTVFLQGNHDWAMAEHVGPSGPYRAWLGWGGRATLEQYRRHPTLLAAHAAWLGRRPLFYETEHLLFSHAGFADVPSPTDPTNGEGVLWRRGPLQNLGKLQVVGHTPTDDNEPYFDVAANAIYLDTGAAMGGHLTGLRLSETGEILEVVAVATYLTDI
ncbi:serine/threonine protein phosphatase [Hymenobacter sp. RP-2-7]|uniref:Serine/threonine protein phosphatase n=1 Tax=Hymenobacter polaris TaxID=2682546 RepID=A0A7Y0ABC9_9BACT|nr:metallophosphoesterase [Hymenobacter polaris]NML64082.1 serine/threonine protein phosphatase [Hymenobacter polaris]